jgi:hypothetical protein
MRASAIAFVEKEVPPILEKKDFEGMYFFGTLTLKGKLTEPEFGRWFEELGDFEDLGDLKVARSTVGVRGDQAWQFVDLTSRARFSKGEVEVHIRAARRSTALPEWRIEEFQLSPVE